MRKSAEKTRAEMSGKRFLVGGLEKTDSSQKALLASNLIVIALALLFRWSFLTLAWGYWLQSVTIGFFTVLKIMLAGKIMLLGQEEKKSSSGIAGSLLAKLALSGFFVFHYGLFHFVYAVFLSAGTSFAAIAGSGILQPPGLFDVALIGLIFLVNHAGSFLYHYVWGKERLKANIMNIFVEPYQRVIPMHLTIMAGGFASVFAGMAFAFAGIDASAAIETTLLLVFLSLKTWVDFNAHNFLHAAERGFSKAERRSVGSLIKEGLGKRK
jgi:hypothetical protein